MTIESKKSIVLRIWKEIWRDGNFENIHELVDDDYMLHAYVEDLEYGSGAEGLKRLISTWQTNFPDSHMTIEELIAEGDKVVTRYTAQITPSAATKGIWIDRIQNNKVVESWVDWDRLGLFRQLGVIPG